MLIRREENHLHVNNRSSINQSLSERIILEIMKSPDSQLIELQYRYAGKKVTIKPNQQKEKNHG